MGSLGTRGAHHRAGQKVSGWQRQFAELWSALTVRFYIWTKGLTFESTGEALNWCLDFFLPDDSVLREQDNMACVLGNSHIRWIKNELQWADPVTQKPVLNCHISITTQFLNISCTFLVIVFKSYFVWLLSKEREKEETQIWVWCGGMERIWEKLEEKKNIIRMYYMKKYNKK